MVTIPQRTSSSLLSPQSQFPSQKYRKGIHIPLLQALVPVGQSANTKQKRRLGIRRRKLKNYQMTWAFFFKYLTTLEMYSCHYHNSKNARSHDDPVKDCFFS